MNRYLKQFLATIFVALMLSATPAMAQATRTWVSGVGDDANPCSRTAPCKTFAGAISKTASGGEISVLDPGGFGGVTITKPITLRADGVLGSILVAGTNGINVNLPSGGRVVLDGIELEGLNQTGSPALSGIKVFSAVQLVVIDTTIRGFTNGIEVDTTATTDVTIYNSTIVGSTQYGLSLPNVGGATRAWVTQSLLANNALGHINVNGTSNRVIISGNEFTGRGNPTLVITNNGKVSSYGDNAFSDLPASGYTLIPRN
jgi:hypothetical protein